MPVLSAVTSAPSTLTIPLPSPVTVAPDEFQVIYIVRSNSVLATLSSESSVSSLDRYPPPDSLSCPTTNLTLISPEEKITYPERAVPSLASALIETESPLVPLFFDMLIQVADADAVQSLEDVTVTDTEPPSFSILADEADREMLSFPAYLAKVRARPSPSFTYTLSSSSDRDANTGMLSPFKISFNLCQELPYQAYQYPLLPFIFRVSIAKDDSISPPSISHLLFPTLTVGFA